MVKMIIIIYQNFINLKSFLITLIQQQQQGMPDNNKPETCMIYACELSLLLWKMAHLYSFCTIQGNKYTLIDVKKWKSSLLKICTLLYDCLLLCSFLLMLLLFLFSSPYLYKMNWILSLFRQNTDRKLRLIERIDAFSVNLLFVNAHIKVF